MLSPLRTMRIVRYALYCDGIDDYAKIEPFVIYGWPGITIEELIHPHRPKAHADWAFFSMISVYGAGHAMTGFIADNRYDYTYLNARFTSVKPDGSSAVRDLAYIFTYTNTWVHVVRRYDSSTRVAAGFVNGELARSHTIPADERTVLDIDPSVSEAYRRFVLGANSFLQKNMKVAYACVRIYSRALTDEEISWNYRYPWNPVRSGLVMWLHAHPDYVKDIDNDGILEWVDLSGNNNHAKIYGARLVELSKPPSRVILRELVRTPSR